MVAVLAPAAITATPSRLQQCDRRRRQHRAQHRQRVESLRGALGDDGKQLEVSTARRHLLPHPADLLAPAERRCIARAPNTRPATGQRRLNERKAGRVGRSGAVHLIRPQAQRAAREEAFPPPLCTTAAH